MQQPSQLGHRDRDIRALCQHASDLGQVCGSPALSGESFCYYHYPDHQRVPTRSQRRARIRARRNARRSFSVPRPSNRDELQRAVAYICFLIEADQIDLHRAGQLLSALDAARNNLIE